MATALTRIRVRVFAVEAFGQENSAKISAKEGGAQIRYFSTTGYERRRGVRVSGLRHDQMNRQRRLVEGGSAIITNLVGRALQGDAAAEESLRVVVYDLIREIASYHRNSERKGHTFQPTAIAHEIWMRLEKLNMAPVLACKNTPATKAYIGAMIRSFLVNCARQRKARLKAEHGHQREQAEPDIQLDLSAFAPGAVAVGADVFVDALGRLAEFDAEAAQAFELRVFGALKWQEVAEMMACAVRTAQLAHKRARMFLAREIRRSIEP